MTAVAVALPARKVEARIDGREVSVTDGSTILDAARALGIDTPTLCYFETLSPVNVCRACVVEVEGSRVLVPACSRPLEEGMEIQTDTERVRHSRKLVLEMLASSVDLDRSESEIRAWVDEYQAEPARFAEPKTVAQPVKVDNDLYVRDYGRCILCYRCVEACGVDAQNTFAIAVAGRGFEAHISTEFGLPLTDSACVYCGNCVAVCPTGALMDKSEFDMRDDGTWDPDAQAVTRTICPFCGVGCNLELHVQDNTIVKVTSPMDHDVTSGNLCIKGRFGWAHVQNRPE